MITYNCDFAAELVLDLTGLDCIWRMLLDELVQVLDTHLGDLSSSISRVSGVAVVDVCSYNSYGGRLEVTIAHVTSTRAGIRAITSCTCLGTCTSTTTVSNRHWRTFHRFVARFQNVEALSNGVRQLPLSEVMMLACHNLRSISVPRFFNVGFSEAIFTQ
jgi:hypothetical protein